MPPSATLELVQTSERAREAWQERKEEIFRETFAPAPLLTPSECAEKHRILTQGPRAGQRWSNDVTPYLVEIMDFVAAPWARRGVVRKSARVGYTEGVIGNVILWTVHSDPCPAAIVQPTDGEAESYSREQVEPLVQKNEVLSSKIGETGSRSSDATMTFKRYPGGFLSILGSASDKNLRRRSFRRVFVDEVDGMKVASDEGDPLLRLAKRTDDFEDGVMMVGSTPTLAGQSRIDREFEKTDQRYWHVSCPHCDEEQVLRWGGRTKPYGIKWDQDLFCRGCGAEKEEAGTCPDCGSDDVEVRHLPETAHYVCAHCSERIEEEHKAAMVRGGRWIPTNPAASTPGWHIDALISLFPGARWAKLTMEWLEAQADPDDLQVFVNTVLGEAWEERDQKEADTNNLGNRAEEFVDASGEVVDVPDGVGVLTAAVDVQGSWLELLVRGWGIGEESWDILHERIHGDPEAKNTWARLEALLTRSYRHAAGTRLRIMCALIDAGYATDTVYAFTKPREDRNVFAVLGDRTGSPDHQPLKGPSKANAAKAQVFTVGTYKQKDQLFRRLAIQRPGPRYIHLRSYNAERCNGFDANYFEQFKAEKKVNRRPKGSRKRRWMFVPVEERNEAIDLHVYNQGALQVLGAGVRQNLEKWVDVARRGRAAAASKPRRRVRSKGVE